MIYIFAMHPIWYLVPALITLAVWMLGARFWPKSIPLKGEMGMMRDPGIILFGSLLWFITVPFAVMGILMFVLAALVSLIIGKGE